MRARSRIGLSVWAGVRSVAAIACLAPALAVGSALAIGGCESYHHQPALLPASSTAEPTSATAGAGPSPLGGSSPGASASTLPLAAAPAGSEASSDAGPRAVAVEDPNQIHTQAPVLFETASDKVRDSDVALKALAESLKSSSEVTLVRVEDHVDEAGLTAGGALALSQRRAMSVAKKLAGLGVDCERLLPVGFGAAKAQRGLVFIKAAIRGRPIGGPVAGGGAVAGDPCR